MQYAEGSLSMNKKYPVTIYFYPLLEEEQVEQSSIETMFKDSVMDYDNESILYIHIPYCISHCTFCPFNTKVIKNYSEISSIVDSLIEEMKLLSNKCRNINFKAVYYGGGSPSVLEANDIIRLHQSIRNYFNIQNAEITFEGELVTLGKESTINALRKIGVHRISLGMQTFDDQLRRMFNIQTTSLEARTVIKKLLLANFDEVNIDMMYGLPNQTIKGLQLDISKTIDLGVDSVDYYRLHPYSLPSSQQGDWINQADERRDEFKTEIINQFEASGYENVCDQVFSKVGLSKYSKLMWGQTDNIYSMPSIVALGPSARGYLGGCSYMNTAKISSYKDFVNSEQLPIEKISQKRDFIERKFVFATKYFEIPYSIFEAYEKISVENPAKKWLANGLIEHGPHSYILTNRGKLCIDEMIVESMPASQYSLALSIEGKIKGIENLRTGRF